MVPLLTGVCDGVRHCRCLPWVSSAYCGWPPGGKSEVKLVGLWQWEWGTAGMWDHGVHAASRVGQGLLQVHNWLFWTASRSVLPEHQLARFKLLLVSFRMWMIPSWTWRLQSSLSLVRILYSVTLKPWKTSGKRLEQKIAWWWWEELMIISGGYIPLELRGNMLECKNACPRWQCHDRPVTEITSQSCIL